MSISLSFSKQGVCQKFAGIYHLLPPEAIGTERFEAFHRLNKDVQFLSFSFYIGKIWCRLARASLNCGLS